MENSKFFNRGISTPVGIIIIVLFALIAGGILAWQYFGIEKEEVVTDETANWKTYRNEKYGYEMKYPRSFTVDKMSGEVFLSLPDPLIEASVSIFVDKELSVLLSGTFGGRYLYSEETSVTRTTGGKVFFQEVVLNNIVFKKDYWVEYGGMGGWDNVINCYTKYKDNYYIISINHMFVGGVPGMVTAEGKEITKEEIINGALTKMLDNENEYVKVFNQMLSTFRFLE